MVGSALDHSDKGDAMRKLVGQRVTYRVVGGGVGERVFMDTNRYSVRLWREGLAVAILGDHTQWQRIELGSVTMIYQ